MRNYKPRNRLTLIEQRNQNSLTQLLKAKDKTIDDKREMVKERNPYLFVFGDNLLPQSWHDYDTYINKLYIGEVDAQQTRTQGEHHEST